MDAINIFIYTAAAVGLILGVVVFLSDKKNKINQLFLIVALSTVIWIVSNALITLEPRDFWIRNTYATGIVIIPSILAWIIRFITKKKIGFLKLSIILSGVVLFPVLTYFTDFIVKGADVSSSGDFSGTFGTLFPLFATYSILLSAYILFLVTKKYNNSKGVERTQYGYIALGLYGFGVVSAIVDFVLPIFGINSFIPLDSPSSIIFISAMSFVILKHNLFNIRIIVTELLVFSLWIIILIRTIVSDNFGEISFNIGLLILTIIIGIFLIKSVLKEVNQREKIELLATDLQKANTRLLDLDKQKSEFISFATHQLRAPITAMKGYSSLILEGEMGKLTKAMKEAVTRIYESSKTLANVVDDYLNISRIELGTMKYTFEIIDMKKFVADIIAEIKPNIEKSGLAVSFTTTPNSPEDRFMIHADRDKFKQVIMNIIDNSLKYTPKGSMDVSLVKHAPERKIIFSVKDTGVGISTEVMPKLFSKFVRADNANKQNIYGTGLGLFVAKEIVASHKGRLWAESDGEGKGSTFFLEMDMEV